MSEVAEFSAIETLRDGRRVEIRALRHEDRNGLEGSRQPRQRSSPSAAVSFR